MEDGEWNVPVLRPWFDFTTSLQVSPLELHGDVLTRCGQTNVVSGMWAVIACVKQALTHEGRQATSSCVIDLARYKVHSPFAVIDVDEGCVVEEEDVHRYRIVRRRETLNYSPRSCLVIFYRWVTLATGFW